MRADFISDPHGDRVVAQERRDRDLEQSSDPSIWLGPTERCRECGYMKRELTTGHWACPCDGWSVKAA